MSRMTHKRAVELGGKSSWSEAECREAKFEMARARGRELDLEHVAKTLESQRDELKAALDASDAQHREALQKIEALANMLEALWGWRVQADKATWRIDLDDEEAEKVTAALRLAGRLK